MSLPGTRWLVRQLSAVDDLAGGYHRKMANPLVSGAGFAMSTVLILAWVAALLPLSLVALWRSLAKRWRSRAQPPPDC